MTGTSLTGGVTDAYTYNTFGEVTQYEAKYGTTVLFKQLYTRDALGRITQKQELVDGVTTTWGYGYDSLGRLTTVTRNGSSYASYGYDVNGNRTSVTRGGVTKTAAYDGHDRLVSDADTGYSFSYDDSGMLKSRTKAGVTETFAYDEFGVLTSTSIGGVSYVIDGANRRVGKRKGTGIVQGFLYQDQLRPAVELGASNVIVNRFVYADRSNIPAYFVRQSKLYRIIADHLGSPRVVVDAATGAVVQRLDFDEFGRVLKDTSPGFQPFGFAGGIYDLDTKLVRFGARDYDPAIGRWTSKDPIGFAGGDTNLYGYVLQDPVNFIDPHGEDAVDSFFAGAMDGFTFGGFSYLMDSMGMLNRVDDPCAYELGAKAVEYFDNFNPRGWLRRGGARMSMAKARLPRYQGPKPRYAINNAHVPGHPDFNPEKTPLPADAELVFRKAVPNDPLKKGPWFGENSKGVIYRYSDSNDGTAHFSGMEGVGDGIRNIKAYARKRLKGLQHDLW